MVKGLVNCAERTGEELQNVWWIVEIGCEHCANNISAQVIVNGPIRPNIGVGDSIVSCQRAGMSAAVAVNLAVTTAKVGGDG